MSYGTPFYCGGGGGGAIFAPPPKSAYPLVAAWISRHAGPVSSVIDKAAINRVSSKFLVCFSCSVAAYTSSDCHVVLNTATPQKPYPLNVFFRQNNLLHWWVGIRACCGLVTTATHVLHPEKIFVILQLYWWLFSSAKHSSWNMD